MSSFVVGAWRVENEHCGSWDPEIHTSRLCGAAAEA